MEKLCKLAAHFLRLQKFTRLNVLVLLVSSLIKKIFQGNANEKN